MMFGSGQIEEAMLYYLYMMSDGEVSYSEEKLFAKICEDQNLTEDDKQVAIDRCKEVTKYTKSPFHALLSEKLDDQVGQGWFGLKDASALARIIWNLVNLGYADTCYSDEEKAIVNHLVKKWEVKPEVYHEMVDTADTILALTKQREWIALTYGKGSASDKREKIIDSEIETMLSDIKITIDELTM